MTDHEKAVKVLRSQGRAPSMLRNCSQSAASELSAMYGAPDLPQRFSAWLDVYYKATIDDDEPTELDEPRITKTVSTNEDGS